MPELTKTAYLNGIAEQFLREFGDRWEVYRGKEKEVLDPDDQYLVLVNKEDPSKFVKLEVELGKAWLLGRYKVKITATDVTALEKLGEVVEERYRKTFLLHTDKKQFLAKVYDAITNTLYAWKSTEFRKQVRGYKEKAKDVLEGVARSGIGKYLAVGIEFDDNGVHPVFGLAFGDKLGGLVLYDPVNNELEIGGFVGYGPFGVGGVYEIPISEIGKTIAEAGRAVARGAKAAIDAAADSLKSVAEDVVEVVKGVGSTILDAVGDSDNEAAAVAVGVAAAVALAVLLGYGGYRLGKYIYNKLKSKEKPWYEKYEFKRLELEGNKVKYVPIDVREIEAPL